VAVVEESARADFVPPEGFQLIDHRDYGDARIHFLKNVPLLGA